MPGTQEEKGVIVYCMHSIMLKVLAISHTTELSCSGLTISVCWRTGSSLVANVKCSLKYLV